MMRLLVFFLLASSGMGAQNLVINPGFEDNSGLNQSQIGFNSVAGWSMPSDGTSDYRYFTDEQLDTTITKRVANSVYPYEGNAFGGFIGSERCHEYIEGSLSEKLVKGQQYKISFAMAPNHGKTVAEQRIGISFSDRKRFHAVPGMSKAPWKADLFLINAIKKTEAGKWTVYTLVYTATGGEEFFIFGDFWNYKSAAPPGTGNSYNNLDNVSVERYEPEISDADTLVAESDTVITEHIVSDTSAITPGKTLVLQNIHFATGQSQILPESYQPLYDIILEMKLQPNLKVEIIGHTDKHGNAASNQQLSEQRALAVKAFFVSKGIDASRITTSGKGSSEPISDDDSKNRRVEFVFSE